MFDLITLEFPDVSVALVGPQNRIKGIKAYCDYCDRNGLPINFDNMIGRIIDNRVFERIEEKQ